MAKFYVESGTLQMITEADDARGAALWGVHSCLEQVLPTCAGDPRTPQDKRECIGPRGWWVLGPEMAVSERGFGRKDAARFDTSELFAEWNQLMRAIRRLQQQLAASPCETARP